ncbi:MAG: hypothetical protein PHZ19_07985 [Candidatus Thermoplasmatota archaeon]|nr:hypothetical protein [Candidatus Thermoplasmatota archaeon]
MRPIEVKMLKQAIVAARRLSYYVEHLNLFLAGTPEEITTQLEALNTTEATPPEAHP